jgi:HIRAN domain
MSKPITTLTGLLVGMHFRPPAKLILETLKSGTELQLVHEPDNEYDSNAIRVYVRLGEVPESQHGRLEAELPGFGWDIETFRSRAESGEALMLGYVAASKNKALREDPTLVSNEAFLGAQDLIPWSDCSIRLGFAPSGAALVILSAPQ